MKRWLVAAVVLLGVFAVATPAWAHVTVSAPGAVRGGSDQEITFRVPVEKTIPTVGLTVALPTNTPIASVDVLPVPGWTHAQKTVHLATPIHTDDGDITEAVAEVTWTAHDGGLRPGEFGAFTIIAGQLPDVAELRFAAIQRYQDGSVVNWNQTAAPGAEEPENPAPVLTLAASGAATDAAGPHPVATVTVAGPRGRSGSSTPPTVLAIIAILVAGFALFIALSTRARKETSKQTGRRDR